MKEDEMIICRCEEVSYEELETTAAEYKCSARELKLRTRAGMGYCGGRSCRTMVDKIAATTANDQNRTSVSLKYQPPIRPISFENLGG
ncbi:(2Fe-2S)-binding protein [Alteribacillus bidgolensis]|uniref:BFD-like [2Fe-2S] binding domain-containing protein n=1 Tax=Alteribacillus bidgolensis TaxID=930129 RepID=A0A1G8NKE8_9BACI|nr:(2Fe-2S)-binding protein [Alteribacillus bidgolensis]SDI80648.1 BFD-like [2Fe-2S] binding domain-containing protein [Alteribacillus bidgolensis]